MINPNTSVLLRYRLPNFSSPIQEIYACSSCGKYIILDDNDNEVSFNRSDFLIHYPHINTPVRVTDTDSHFFPLGTIAKLQILNFGKTKDRSIPIIPTLIFVPTQDTNNIFFVPNSSLFVNPSPHKPLKHRLVGLFYFTLSNYIPNPLERLKTRSMKLWSPFPYIHW